jgi:hypothetical protein
MNRGWIIAYICVMVGGSLFAFAQTQPVASTQSIDHAPSPEISALIQQLGSDDWRSRDNAQKKLVDLGPAAIDALTPIAQADGGDPEVKSRAAAAIAQIHELDSSGPSLVTLHFKDASLDTVLNSLATQAHAKRPPDVFGNNLVGPTLSIDVDHKLFWEVLEEICTSVSMTPPPGARGASVFQLGPYGQNWLVKAPHIVSGPFLISVVGVSHFRSIDLANAVGTQEQFIARMMLNAEPKLLVTQVMGFDLKEAKDDAGHSLIPPANPRANPMVFYNRRFGGGETEVQMAYPANPGKKIAVIKGNFNIALGQDIGRFEINHLSDKPKVTKPLQGYDIQANLTSSGNEYEVNLTFNKGSLKEEQWQAMSSRFNEIVVCDASGVQISTNGMRTSGSSLAGNSTYQVTLMFARGQGGGAPIPGINNVRIPGGAIVGPVNAGEPESLSWDLPLKVKSISIPVEFHDLPMP